MLQSRLSYSIVSVALSILLTLSALTKDALADDPMDTIKVGILFSQSGSMAEKEKNLRDLMTMLIAEQNARGGLLGRQLEAIAADPASDWKLYAEEARALIRDHAVSVVFGGYTSISRKFMLPVMEEFNNLLIYPAQFEGEEESRNIFYFGSTPEQQAVPAIEFLMQKEDPDKWLLVGTDYVLPRITNRIVSNHLTTTGVKDDDILTYYEPFDSDRWEELADEIARLSTGNERIAVVSSIFGASNSSFYEALRNRGVSPERVPVMSLSLDGDDVASLANRALAGSYVTRGYFQGIDTQANQDFVTQWRAFTGDDAAVVTDDMASLYLGFKTWTRSVEQASSVVPSKVIDVMKGIALTDVTGADAKLDGSHQISKKMYVAQIRADNELELLADTPSMVRGVVWSESATDSGRLISDWRKDIQCGDFDATTGKCSKPANARLLDLLFATTRNVKDLGGERLNFERDRAGLSFGTIQVSVPKDHQIGKIDRQSFFPWLFGRDVADSEFVLRSAKVLSKEQLLKAIAHGDSKRALIYVHGFNNSFQDGAFRLAQLIWDMQYRGIPVLFAWPTREDAFQYVTDYENAEFSSDGFRELLRILKTEAKVDQVDVIVHSMGSRVVLLGLTSGDTDLGPLPINELIFAAPDFDRDNFKSALSKIQKMAKAVTLYVNSNDWALALSKKIRSEYSRAGDVDAVHGPVVMPGLETIDVSAIGKDFFGLNHSSYSDKLVLINEIAQIILNAVRPPNIRTPVLVGMPEGSASPTYWRYPD